MLRRFAVLLLITVASASPVATFATSEDEPSLTARMGSKVIDPRDVGRYHCHDLDFPQITCFETARALAEAVATHEDALAGPTAVAFVRVFEHEAFGGASAVLSQSYARLADIGWNDRITSFRGLNGGSGNIFKNAQFSGDAYAFCCNQQVNNVGSAWNDSFSSISGSA